MKNSRCLGSVRHDIKCPPDPQQWKNGRDGAVRAGHFGQDGLMEESHFLDVFCRCYPAELIRLTTLSHRTRSGYCRTLHGTLLVVFRPGGRSGGMVRCDAAAILYHPYSRVISSISRCRFPRASAPLQRVSSFWSATAWTNGGGRGAGGGFSPPQPARQRIEIPCLSATSSAGKAYRKPGRYSTYTLHQQHTGVVQQGQSAPKADGA